MQRGPLQERSVQKALHHEKYMLNSLTEAVGAAIVSHIICSLVQSVATGVDNAIHIRVRQVNAISCVIQFAPDHRGDPLHRKHPGKDLHNMLERAFYWMRLVLSGDELD